jgi:hypothetical protein
MEFIMRLAAKLLFSVILLTSFAANAQTPNPPVPPGNPNDTGAGPRFDAVKQQHLARLERLMSCVRQSQTFEAMRACHPQHH